MPVESLPATELLPILDSFDTIIDARSEAEFALDQPAWRGELAHAAQCRAPRHRHFVQAGQPLRGAQAWRGHCGAQHRRPHHPRGARQAPPVAPADLLLAWRAAQRVAVAGAGADRLSGDAGRGRLQGFPCGHRCRYGPPCPEPALPGRLRHHRLGQDPVAACAAAPGRPGAGSRRAGGASQLGARCRARAAATLPEGLRHPHLGPAPAAGPGPPGVSWRAKAARSATWPCRRS
jgi:hypothetical protein